MSWTLGDISTQEVGEAYRKWFTKRGVPTAEFNFKEAIAELGKQCQIDVETIKRITQKMDFYLKMRAQK